MTKQAGSSPSRAVTEIEVSIPEPQLQILHPGHAISHNS